MALTKQILLTKVEIYHIYDSYPAIRLFESITFDDPDDDTLPETSNRVRELSPSENLESPMSVTYPDVSGEEQIVQDISSAIWSNGSP